MRAVVLLALALTACTSPQPVATTIVCPPLVTYTPAQQKAAAAALAALSVDNALVGYMIDYERLRDADRACMGSKP